jgi:hypothetical protein
MAEPMARPGTDTDGFRNPAGGRIKHQRPKPLPDSRIISRAADRGLLSTWPMVHCIK